MMKEIVNEKNSFILYCNYEEQLNMLTDVQVGQLCRGIFAYVRTGKQHSNDPMVTMLLSVICHQLDMDAQRYAETRERRREAGRKAGKASAEKRARQKEQPMETNVDDTERFQHVNVNENVNENENVNVNVNDSILSGGDGGSGEEEEYACARELIFYTDNQYPTTQTELDKCSAFTDKLFRSYWNREPSQYDMAQVFDYVQGYGQLPDSTGYAVFDAEKAELLLYVFKLAANSDRPKWSYVDGVYKRFRERDIHTLYDAQLYDWELTHGKGVLV